MLPRKPWQLQTMEDHCLMGHHELRLTGCRQNELNRFKSAVRVFTLGHSHQALRGNKSSSELLFRGFPVDLSEAGRSRPGCPLTESEQAWSLTQAAPWAITAPFLWRRGQRDTCTESQIRGLEEGRKDLIITSSLPHPPSSLLSPLFLVSLSFLLFPLPLLPHHHHLHP